jgi:hypothetical protein
MMDVRQDRMTNPPPSTAAAAASAVGMAHSSPLYLQHHAGALPGTASGPGTYAGGYSAPLPAVADAAAASDLSVLRMTRTPRHSQPPAHLAVLQEQQQQQQSHTFNAAAASCGPEVSFPPVQFSAHSTTSAPGAAAGAAAASALPGLLALLKQRAPVANQQQLLREMAGGRMHSSCPSDSRAPRSSPGFDAAAYMADGLPRLTPINTGRRSSADPMGGYQLPVGHSQSDPLPGHGALTLSMQQQILMQLQQQLHDQQHGTQRSSSFHGFPEASAGSGGSSGIPTPLFSYSHLAPGAPAGRTMVTPLTGIKYQYPCSSGGSGSSKTAAAATASTAATAAGTHTAPLPNLAPMRSSGSSSGPLWVPGTSSLARSGSLGTSSRHWYWQRSSGAAAAAGEDGGGSENDDVRSVTDQEGPAEKLVDDQRGCPDVMARLQTDNNWYV